MTWDTGLLALSLALVAFVVSSAIVLWVLVALPANYFRDSARHAFLAECRPITRGAILIGKNALGFFLVLFGALLSLPGIPGPGSLLVLIGVMLLDFPGKRRLERTLVRRPMLLRPINRLRTRFGKPPLLVDFESPSSATDGTSEIA